ncbi:MAG: iron chaperone [Moraxellaceae bacterium]
MTAPHPSDIDSYIAAAAPEAQALLRELRHIATSSVPEACETIAYQMPALRLNRVFFYFAAFQKHIGIYPPVKDAALVKELAPWRGPKGNLKFPLQQPIPYELVQRLVIALALEYGGR